jgi:hypothetical protein
VLRFHAAFTRIVALCCNFDLALIFTRPSKTNFEPRAGEMSIISSPIGFDLV